MVCEFDTPALRSCHSISIRFKSDLTWSLQNINLFFLSHSEVVLLVCLGSLSCCITQVRLSLRAQTTPDILLQDFQISAEFMFMEAPDHHRHHLHVWLWYDFIMKCYAGFMPDVMGHTFQKVQLVASFPKILGVFFSKCKTSHCVLFGQKWVYLGTLPWMVFLPSLFLIVESWTLALIEPVRPAFFRCCSGFFYDLLDESSLRLE